MLIYALADIHGSLKRISLIKNNIKKFNPDLVVVAGDITNYTHSVPIIERLNGLQAQVLAVRGNTDMPRIDHLLDVYPNTTSLHFKQISINGIRFAGISGTLPVPFSSRIRLRENHALKKLQNIMEHPVTLVIHTPPRGTLDHVMGKFSAGSGNLYKFLLKNQPDMLLCGHIHESAGIKYLGKTLVVNCSISKSSAGALIEYHKGRKPGVEMLKRTETQGDFNKLHMKPHI